MTQILSPMSRQARHAGKLIIGFNAGMRMNDHVSDDSRQRIQENIQLSGGRLFDGLNRAIGFLRVKALELQPKMLGSVQAPRIALRA